VPNWVATPGENTMTVVGVLKIDGVQSNDPKDIVAAFRGLECVGVTQPKYFSRTDSYILFLSIFGKENADLTYKVYDASTGTIYPSVSVSNESAYAFAPDKTIGTYNNPVTFTTENAIEQDLSMNTGGWKWFSLYAVPKNTNPSVVFKDALDAISVITDGKNTLINWGAGSLTLNNPATMYKLNATEAFQEVFAGTPTDPTAIDITLKKDWTWIGYPAQAMNSLDAAFADAEPQEGDMVKNQTGFSIYTGDEWIGTLTAVVPGEGYLYNSTAAASKTFRFPKPAVTGKTNARRKSQISNLKSQFRDNMTMIAVVKDGERVIEDAVVSVYVGNELRGQSTEAVTDGKHFLTIGGNGQADVLTFVVSTSEGDHYLLLTDVFQANAMRGSMAQPVVLQLNGTTGIDAIDNAQTTDNYYDLQGRKVNSANMSKGVYINNRQKRVVKQ